MITFKNKEITEITKNNSIEVIDHYSSADIPHWSHMPLTYSYEDKDQCYPIRIERNEIAIKEIEKLTNNSVRFVATDISPDITFNCTKVSQLDESIETLGDHNLTYYDGNPNVIKKAEIYKRSSDRNN